MSAAYALPSGAALVPRADLPEAYVPPLRADGVDLALDANEGGKPEAFASLLGDLPAWRARAESALSLARAYPDARELEAAIARRFGLDPDSCLACCGSDDALSRSLRAFARPGSRVLVLEPGFAMFRVHATLAGAEALGVPWPEGTEFPLDAVAKALRDDPGIGALCLASPANPTGAAITEEAFDKLAGLCRGRLLVADGAYAEFARFDLRAAAARLIRSGRADVVALGTFSKAYGLAGLRVGYALAAPSTIGALRAAGLPYPVGGLAAAIALEALGNEAALARSVAFAREARGRIFASLAAAGAEVFPSEANFVFARLRDARAFAAALAGRGIAVRSWPEGSALADAVRVGCPPDDCSLGRLEAAIAAAGGFA
ncbi:MAG: histidinol-phosphate aminotransferase family protein [Spirochaetales bacterium]|nr:histidinol-phosphate aminotransferase family protein [Spirochaetales bacterium]